MRATEVLQKCLGAALDSMHALRSRALLRAVEATLRGRRLTLMDLARAWPNAERVRAPLKALDRLLGNRHLHAERVSIYAAMARWLARSEQPVIKPAAVPDEPSQCVSCKTLYALATRAPRDLGMMQVARSTPLEARVVLHGKPPQGRKHCTRYGSPARNSNSRQNAQRESEPWLLMASPQLTLTARQLVSLYAQRMQIELSFRDLKSHRYGQAFEDSLTRKGPRIEVLLLLDAMAAFAAWLVGMACEARGIDQWLTPFRSQRRLYSVMRLGQEALARRWLHISLDRLITPLRQWGVHA